MAIFVKPRSDAEAFLKSVIAAALHGSPRRVPGWAVMTADGQLTMSEPALSKKAFLLPHVENGQVVLHLKWAPGQSPDSAIYAAYHGRFVELLLTYFTDRVELISCS